MRRSFHIHIFKMPEFLRPDGNFETKDWAWIFANIDDPIRLPTAVYTGEWWEGEGPHGDKWPMDRREMVHRMLEEREQMREEDRIAYGIENRERHQRRVNETLRNLFNPPPPPSD